VKPDKKQKPRPEDYGYIEQQGFDDLPSGWAYEKGEEEYYKALKIWEEQQKND